MLNERSGDVERRAWNFAAIDPVAHLDAFLERRAEIACAGHPGHEQLMRGSRHDLGPEPLRISLVPMRVVAVTEEHGVNVAIPEAGKDVHAFGGDHLGIFGDGQGSDLADGCDAFVVDQDDAVRERRPAETVDQPAPDQRRRARDGGKRERAGQDNQGEKSLQASHVRDCRGSWRELPAVSHRWRFRAATRSLSLLVSSAAARNTALESGSAESFRHSRFLVATTCRNKLDCARGRATAAATGRRTVGSRRGASTRRPRARLQGGASKRWKSARSARGDVEASAPATRMRRTSFRGTLIFSSPTPAARSRAIVRAPINAGSAVAKRIRQFVRAETIVDPGGDFLFRLGEPVCENLRDRRSRQFLGRQIAATRRGVRPAIAQDVDQLQAFPVLDPKFCHFVRRSSGKGSDMSKPQFRPKIAHATGHEVGVFFQFRPRS